MRTTKQTMPDIAQIIINIVEAIGETQRTQLRQWADGVNENEESEAVILASDAVRAAFLAQGQATPIAA